MDAFSMHIVGWRKKYQKNITHSQAISMERDFGRLCLYTFLFFFCWFVIFGGLYWSWFYTFDTVFVTTCWYLWKDAAFNDLSIILYCVSIDSMHYKCDTYVTALGIEGMKKRHKILFDIKMLYNITKQYRSHTLNTNKVNRGSPFLLAI